MRTLDQICTLPGVLDALTFDVPNSALRSEDLPTLGCPAGALDRVREHMTLNVHADQSNGQKLRLRIVLGLLVVRGFSVF